MRAFATPCLLALSLLGAGAAVQAPVATAASTVTYRWVDADGVVHYSDTPHPGAEKIQLTGAQTYHGTPAPTTSTSAPPPPPPSGDTGYQSCAITQPGPDSNLFAPETVNISVRTVPGLRPGDTIGVQLDGDTLQPVGDGMSFQIAQPDRGSHTISAEVHAADGTLLCSATPVSFTVQRPSVNSPQSPVKPH